MSRKMTFKAEAIEDVVVLRVYFDGEKSKIWLSAEGPNPGVPEDVWDQAQKLKEIYDDKPF